MKLSIQQIRKDMPDYGDKVFLNSAGASLMPRSVVEIINEYLRAEEVWGGYAVEDRRVQQISGFYRQCAELLHCAPRNIAFCHDATDAYTKALSSIPFERGDVILTSDDDYASNHIQFISLQKRFGVELRRMRNLDNGNLDLDDCRHQIRQHRPKLLALTHVPTNSGLIQDVEAVGDICRQEEVLYLVDACQSVGQLVVDVERIGCDFLSATGRKFLRGPRGTGFLYVADRLLEAGYYPLFIDGGGAKWTGPAQFEYLDSARRFQTWEAPYALIAGLSEAIRYANTLGLEVIRSYNLEIMNHLREKLSAVKGVQLYDKGSHKANIVTFRKEGYTLPELKAKLEENRIFFSVSSKEWGWIDYEKKGIDGTIRLSPHYFNTVEEIALVSEVVEHI